MVFQYVLISAVQQTISFSLIKRFPCVQHKSARFAHTGHNIIEYGLESGGRCGYREAAVNAKRSTTNASPGILRRQPVHQLD